MTGRLGTVRRAIAGLMPLWLWGFVVTLVLDLSRDVPWWFVIVPFACLALGFVRAPRVDRPAVEVAAPVQGRWVAINSPATKVPSHGIRSHGQTYAIDILHPRPAGTPAEIGWRDGFRRPERFSSYGEPVHAAADGVVVHALDGARDHRSRSSWPAYLYLFTVESVRDLFGSRGMLGNHVVIEHGDGVFSTSAHLRRGSLLVRPGDRVEAGQQVGEVGNSGNTSEPHLHWQLQDRKRSLASAGIPFAWRDIDVLVDEPDTSWSNKAVSTEVTPGVPATGQVFVVGAAPLAR